MSDIDLEKRLQEQVEYYRARAPEYDQWFLREGRYDLGPEMNRWWLAEIEEVARALREIGPAGRVLELACGTGLWTQRLARYAGALTAVDASDEVLELNRRRLPDARIRYVKEDLFRWRPEEEYDLVFFSFWLSHVPPERFNAFWDLVRSCLAPGGRFFFVDSRTKESTSSGDHLAPAQDRVKRILNNGSEFEIYKVFYDPVELAIRLEALGWKPTIRTTERFLLYGWGERGMGDV